MSDFYQKIFIAVLGAVLGGAIGFGSNYYFAERRDDSQTASFARQSQFAFLKEMYDDRKEFYLEIEEARYTAFNNPTDANLDALVDAFAAVPFVRPRFPTNNLVLGLRDEIAEKLAPLKGDKERKTFLRYGMHKYFCLFDVNLQTIEQMMTIVAGSSDIQEIGVKPFDQELASLDKICLEHYQPRDES